VLPDQSGPAAGLAAGVHGLTVDQTRLRIDTDYPWGGRIRVRVEESAGEWSLHLRVPGWADGAVLVSSGVRTPVVPGYMVVRREWRPGDEVVLELPMAARFRRADPRVNALRGTVAVERGPLVYCLELPGGGDIDGLAVDSTAPLAEEPATGPGDVAVQLRAAGRRWRYPASGLWPYADVDIEHTGPAELPLIPYYAWGNRGPSTMRVFIPYY
jgi:DUF1680 family protein